jgi:hypothetical protein
VQTSLPRRQGLGGQEEAISSVDNARIGVAVTLPATEAAQDISKTCCHYVLFGGRIMTGWCEENCAESQRRRYIEVFSLVVHKYGFTRGCG